MPVPGGRKAIVNIFYLPGHQGGTEGDFDPPSPGSLLSSRDSRVKAGLGIPYPPLNDKLTLSIPALGGGGIKGRITIETTVDFELVAEPVTASWLLGGFLVAKAMGRMARDSAGD